MFQRLPQEQEDDDLLLRLMELLVPIVVTLINQ